MACTEQTYGLTPLTDGMQTQHKIAVDAEYDVCMVVGLLTVILG